MGKFSTIIVKNHRKIRRIIFFGLVVFGLVLLLIPNVSFADDFGSTFENQLFAKNISDLIKMISHIVYVFIWPSLVVAGTALDNSLIFGKFLHLDAALWNIWNIMKNFANFALGFIFVFTIVTNLFKSVGSKSDPMKNALNTIKATLVAGVLVQMSWFLVAVLIDLSTILIVSVGGLPLSMLGSYNKDIANVPIMTLNAEITEDDTFYYYSYGGYNFSPCLLVNKEGDVDRYYKLDGVEGEYIAGRKRLYLSSGTEFQSGYCTLNGYLYSYEESARLSCSDEVYPCYDKDQGDTLEAKNTSYYNQLTQYIINSGANSGWVNEQKNACFLIKAYGVSYDNDCNQICTGFGVVPYPYTGGIFEGIEDGFTLEKLMANSKGWVGPFITMYSSILSYQELVMNPGSDSIMGNLFGFILNTFFAFMLFIPMAILAVLLIIRIGYLWVVVAISPILVLIHTYAALGGDGPLKTLANKGIFKDKFSVKEIMMKIFSPVVVVFAVSLCIVFLSAVFNAKPDEHEASDKVLSAFGLEYLGEVSSDSNSGGNPNGSGTGSCNSGGKAKTPVSKGSYSVLGLVNIEINAQNYNHGKDIFVRILMELLATGIVRFFMKFAIGMMGKKGEELMKTAEKYITTLPIIRLPGMDEKVGLHAIGIGEGNSNKIIDNLNTKVLQLTGAENQREALENRFGLNKDKDKGNSKSISEAVEYIRKNKVENYSDLDKEYQNALATVGYNSGNFGKFYKAISAENYGKLLGTTPSSGGSVGHTNSEAVMYTSAQLDAAVRTDNTWKAWASGMVAGSVQTSNGVFMVDYLDGKANTANPGNQQYEIIDRDTYEKRHFGDQTVNTITKDIYDKNQEDIDKYLKELNDELKELKKLEDDKTKRTLSPSEEKQYEILKRLSDELSGKNYTLEEIKKGLGL